MTLLCPNCGVAVLTAEFRSKDDEAPIREPVAGNMVLCGGCGDVFQYTGTELVLWVQEIPDHIAAASAVIKSGRLNFRRKPAVN